MFEIIERIIIGDLQPHLINDDDLSIIEKLNRSPISLPYESDSTSMYKEIGAGYRNLYAKPNKKSKLFLGLIQQEKENIINNIRIFLKNVSDNKTLELYALKNIQILKDYCIRLRGYKYSLTGSDYYLMYAWETNSFIAFNLKATLIDLILFYQNTFYPIINKQVESRSQLRQCLFFEELSSALDLVNIQNLPELPNDKTIHQLNFDFVQATFKKIFKNNEIDNSSSGKRLFNFYKLHVNDKQLNEKNIFYKKLLRYWKEQLISNNFLAECNITESEKTYQFNMVLIPLLKSEIEIIEEEIAAGIQTRNIHYGFKCSVEQSIVDEIFYNMNGKYFKANIVDFRAVFAPQPTPIIKPIIWLVLNERGIDTGRGNQTALFVFLEMILKTVSNENLKKSKDLFIDSRGEFIKDKLKRPNPKKISTYGFEEKLKPILTKSLPK